MRLHLVAAMQHRYFEDGDERYDTRLVATDDVGGIWFYDTGTPSVGWWKEAELVVVEKDVQK